MKIIKTIFMNRVMEHDRFSAFLEVGVLTAHSSLLAAKQL